MMLKEFNKLIYCFYKNKMNILNPFNAFLILYYKNDSFIRYNIKYKFIGVKKKYNKSEFQWFSFKSKESLKENYKQILNLVLSEIKTYYDKTV